MNFSKSRTKPCAPDLRTCCVKKGKTWNAASKDARYRHKKTYPHCEMVNHIAATIAEGRTPAYSDPKEDQRHRNKLAMRRKRFREDPMRVLNHRAWKYGV